MLPVQKGYIVLVATVVYRSDDGSKSDVAITSRLYDLE